MRQREGTRIDAAPTSNTAPINETTRFYVTKDVIVAAHDALMRELPPEIEKGLDLAVIDEGFWQVGLGIVRPRA